MKRIFLISSLVVCAATFFSGASLGEDTDWKLPPETARLRPGENSQLVSASCLMCHSADYLSSQPPMDRKAWQATVEKMKAKYGAPLSTNQFEPIVNYLAENYGKKK